MISRSDSTQHLTALAAPETLLDWRAVIAPDAGAARCFGIFVS